MSVALPKFVHSGRPYHLEQNISLNPLVHKASEILNYTSTHAYCKTWTLYHALAIIALCKCFVNQTGEDTGVRKPMILEWNQSKISRNQDSTKRRGSLAGTIWKNDFPGASGIGDP
jgi:hypothetical protein